MLRARKHAIIRNFETVLSFHFPDPYRLPSRPSALSSRLVSRISSLLAGLNPGLQLGCTPAPLPQLSRQPPASRGTTAAFRSLQPANYQSSHPALSRPNADKWTHAHCPTAGSQLSRWTLAPVLLFRPETVISTDRPRPDASQKSAHGSFYFRSRTTRP